MSGALSMKQAAEACGLSRERFRKVWKHWRADLNFPSPFRGGIGETYTWDAEAVQAWKSGRQRALGAVAPAPANDIHPDDRGPTARAARDRAVLARMMGVRG
jgi:predicted DNA-binding transcriptional regulator AlpA